jgi:hypothetical protein
MYAIVHEHSLTSWISGIFQDREQASAYLATIAVELQPQLLEFPIDCYPVYLLEIGRKFTYNREADIITFVSELTLQDDEDWCYGNIYYVDRDWQSRHAGKDYMGIIPHIHLDNERVFGIRDAGIANYF